MPSPCQVLVGGYGLPGWRDLDFGERFVRLAENLEWPQGVVVEDLECSPHLVLHRLQELRPDRLILVGAIARGTDVPGTIRSYRADAPAAPGPAATGVLDRLLAVAAQFGGLPADTLVIEVEAADVSFGPGHSEELAPAIDTLLDTIRNHIEGPGGAPSVTPTPASAHGGAGFPFASSSPGRGPGRAELPAALPGIDQLFQYAEAHAQVRTLEGLGRQLPATDGLLMAARFVPAGNHLGLSGDWHDIVALPHGLVGIVVADVVAGRRVHASTVSAQLRIAFRALALVEGDEPAPLVEHLDGVVASTGVGVGSTLVYLVVDPAAGIVRLASAGHCQPLLLDPDGGGSTVGPNETPVLGTGASRNEVALPVDPGSTLLLYSDGLLRSAGRTAARGQEQLRLAAGSAPAQLEELCDHILGWCLPPDPSLQGDDVSLLAVRQVC